MKKWIGMLGVLLSLTISGDALAGEIQIPLTRVSIEDTRMGEARVLVEVDLTDYEGFAVERAQLTGAPSSGLGAVDVWATAVAPGGADVPYIRSLTSIQSGAEGVACDVTSVLFGAADGTAIGGIVLSLPGWRGEDLPRAVAVALQESLTGAHLTLEGHGPHRPGRPLR